MVKIIKPLNDTQIKSAKPVEKDFTYQMAMVYIY